MHEIVTLQIGSQANYVGTHFWNAQESYFTYVSAHQHRQQEEAGNSPFVNHDVHFRPGQAPDGSDTFTPRTVIYDFKQAFGTLRRINELYEVLGQQNTAAGSQTWGGTTVTQTQSTIPLNEYQRQLTAGGINGAALSTDNVRFWSDFNRVFYHPRSVIQIYESELNPNQRSFDIWPEGEELFESLDKEHDLLDRDLRLFLEEADQLQGFQVFTELGTSWSAFAARYIDRLKDEYDKKALWVWGLDDGAETNATKQPSKLLNEAKALYEISPQTTLYVPLKLTSPVPASFSALDRSSRWHTSAVQVAAIETATLPSRLRPQGSTRTATLDELAGFVNGGDSNRKVGRLNLGMGDGAHSSVNGWDLFSVDDASSDRLRRNRARIRPYTFNEVVVSRGEQVQQTANGSTSAEHKDEEEQRKLQSFHSELRFPLLDSYPRVVESMEGNSTSVRTRLATDSSIEPWIRGLDAFVRPRIPLEERETLSNGLQEIAESYKSGWDGVSDEDSDHEDS